jgi:hypothetical protein
MLARLNSAGERLLGENILAVNRFPGPGLAAGGFFLASLPGFLAAEFPNDAARAELAVEAGVGAGLAEVQALLAVAVFVLLALDAGGPVGVKTAGGH